MTALGDMSPRILRGFLLFLWIGLLLWIAVVAWSGDADVLFRSIRSIVPSSNAPTGPPADSDLDFNDDTWTPGEILFNYLDRHVSDPTDPPPIESVLNAWLVDPSWTEAVTFAEIMTGGSTRDASEDENAALYSAYFTLYRVIDSRLATVASQPEAELGAFSAAMLPPKLAVQRSSNGEPTRLTGTLEFPPEAHLWVERKREELESEAQRKDLADTFLLLIVLGAFGSQVFMIRQYIQERPEDESLPISAYVFRPVLGMFLATAMFVLVFLGQALVSTSSATELRRETLFVLAFAAGLLSEQAYEALRVRAERALEDYKQRRHDGEEQADRG